MKKGLFAIVGAMAMVLALTGCNGDEESGDSSGGGEVAAGGLADATLPTQDGYVTVAFELAEESLTPSSYVSPYLTGAYNDWATGLDATEMTLLDGSETIYYAFIEWDEETFESEDYTPYEYSLVLGYNESAGLSETSAGLQWVDTYKSTEVIAYAYPSNPEWTVQEDGNVWLTTTDNPNALHTFETMPPEPTMLENYHVVFGFLGEVPSWSSAYIVGTMNNWGNSWGVDDSYGTPQDWALSKYDDWAYAKDGYTYYEVNIGSVIANGEITYQVIFMDPTATAVDWTYSFMSGNATLTPYLSDGDNAYVLGGEFDVVPEEVMPDPDSLVDYTIYFVNTSNGGSLSEGVTPHVNASQTGWSAVAMTLESEGYWSLTFQASPNGFEFEGGILGSESWTGACKMWADETQTSLTNLAVTVSADDDLIVVTADYSLLGGSDEYACESIVATTKAAYNA